MRKIVDFGPDQCEAIERLEKQFGSQASVVRAGLALLQVAIREARDGNAVGIIRGDRVVKELVGLWPTPVMGGAAA